jgi:hypothetical protein
LKIKLNRWAGMMEEKIEASEEDEMKVIVDNAKQLSYEADKEGITGFMYGAAVSILSKYWEYGECLRKWHNKDYGYDGNGVVNPEVCNKYERGNRNETKTSSKGK